MGCVGLGVPAGCDRAAANVSAGGKPPLMIPNHPLTPPIGRSGVSAGPRPGRRTRATRPLLRIAVAAGVLLVLASAGTGAFIIRRAFPQITGRLTVPGLLAGVEVIRDRWGVPHIYAANSHDLFFAQGYIQAQDRLWQMDFNRRVPSGRLSEIFGEVTLNSDRFLRTIGMRRAAEAEAARLDGESAAALHAYAAGVNAYVARNGSRLPLEFTLLRYRPEPWVPADSLAFGKLLR